jgi:hypothetical protein
MNRLLKCLGLFFVWLTLLVAGALGAGGMVLQGRVSDPQGNGVAGAELRLIDLARNFLLTPSQGTPQDPALGPIDPNLAEYYYQRGLLLLSENKKSKAIAYLLLYAQTGKNPRQVDRALELIVENQ